MDKAHLSFFELFGISGRHCKKGALHILTVTEVSYLECYTFRYLLSLSWMSIRTIMKTEPSVVDYTRVPLKFILQLQLEINKVIVF